MLAQARRDLIVGSERIADVGNPQRRGRSAVALRRHSLAKTVEGVAVTSARAAVDAWVIEDRGGNAGSDLCARDAAAE